MMQKKVDFIWFIISTGSFFLMSVSFLLMPLDPTVAQYDAMDVIPGLIFWLFLILGIVGQVVLSKRRCKWLAMQGIRKYKIRQGKNGLITFCKNKFALVADLVFVIGLVIFIITTLLTRGLGYICYILLAICVFAFCLHCILNGKIYEYISKLSTKEEELNVKS